MEFHENRGKRPFIGFAILWRAIKKWHLRSQARHTLQKMSNEQLKDIGLRRGEVE